MTPSEAEAILADELTALRALVADLRTVLASGESADLIVAQIALRMQGPR